MHFPHGQGMVVTKSVPLKEFQLDEQRYNIKNKSLQAWIRKVQPAPSEDYPVITPLSNKISL